MFIFMINLFKKGKWGSFKVEQELGRRFSS